MRDLEQMHGVHFFFCQVLRIILILLFYPDHCGVTVLAAVLLPGATAMVLSSDTADTVAFVSHFPGDL